VGCAIPGTLDHGIWAGRRTFRFALAGCRTISPAPGAGLRPRHHQRAVVAISPLLVGQRRGEFAHPLGIFGLGRQVVHFVRIGLKVEQLGLVDLRIADQLPAIGADRSLHVAIGGEGAVADLGGIAPQHGHQALAVQARRYRHAAQLAHGRIHVEQIGDGLRFTLGDSPSGKHQRHVHATELVQVLLAQQAVLAQRKAVVAGHDEQGVVQLAGLAQGLEHAAHLGVEIGGRCIIAGQFPRQRRVGPRPGQRHLVAHGHLAVVERMKGKEVDRHARHRRRILGVELRRGILRIVRLGRGHV